MASSRKPLSKTKKQTVDAAVPPGLGPWQPKARTRPTRTIARRFCTEEKKDASMGEVEGNECGEKGKTVHPRKVQSRFVDGILLLCCLIIAPSKPEIIMLNDNKSLLTP